MKVLLTILAVSVVALGACSAEPNAPAAAAAEPTATASPLPSYNPRAVEDSLDEALAAKDCGLFLTLLQTLNATDEGRWNDYMDAMSVADVKWASDSCLAAEASPTPSPAPTAEPTPTPVPTPALTAAQENAIGTAQDYLDYSSFSRTGLIEQLVFEGFSKADATFAVDSLDVDWNEQAYLMAQSYLEYSSFSLKGLIEQLEYEGFTAKQAKYGATKAYND